MELKDSEPLVLANGISIDYDVDKFVYLPWPEDEPDLEGWCRWAAGVWCDTEGVQVPEEVEESLTRMLHRIATAEDVGGPFQFRFAYIPDLVRGPVPVMLAVVTDPGDVEGNLRYMTGADDPDAVEPPIVDRLQLATGDVALRTLKYLPSDDGLVVALNYAWWAPEGEAYAWVRTASLRPGDIVAAVDDMDEFARGVHVVPETDAPVPGTHG